MTENDDFDKDLSLALDLVCYKKYEFILAKLFNHPKCTWINVKKLEPSLDISKNIEMMVVPLPDGEKDTVIILFINRVTLETSQATYYAVNSVMDKFTISH